MSLDSGRVHMDDGSRLFLMQILRYLSIVESSGFVTPFVEAVQSNPSHAVGIFGPSGIISARVQLVWLRRPQHFTHLFVMRWEPTVRPSRLELYRNFKGPYTWWKSMRQDLRTYLGN